MFRQKRTVLFTALFIFIFSKLIFAAERVEWKDEDKDGRKETQVFYDGDKITKTLIDKNGDGNPDQWVYFKNGKRSKAEIDSDFDGKIDTWLIYDSKGIKIQSAKDTNHDGKPDVFLTFLKGRDLVIKEYDRNFDGRIDRRALMQWNGNKRIVTYIDGRTNYIPNPGYVALWREEDNDYDGKIDVYRERENKNPPTDKIGKEIDPLPVKPQEKPSPPKPSKKKKANGSENLIDKMNEKYGLK